MEPENDNSTPAAASPITLSAAILAPLDALFKAQIHSSRAFINYLFQMAYPHLPLNDKGEIDRENIGEELKKPYTLDIPYQNPENQEIGTIKVPVLALMPVTPLGIEEAKIDFSMSVENVNSHKVIQQSEAGKEDNSTWDRSKRPWFLVDEPKSIVGSISSDANTNDASKSNIQVSITVRKQPIPAALDKALTALTQTIQT